MKGDIYAVVPRDGVGELGKGRGASHHVFDGLARSKLRAAPRNLNDAITLGIGEATNRRDNGLR